MGQLHVELVAADRQVWEGEASMVSARGTEGDIGIMPGHIPVVTALAAGEVRIVSDGGGRQTVHTDGGFMSVDHDRVTIVAENVTTASQE